MEITMEKNLNHFSKIYEATQELGGRSIDRLRNYPYGPYLSFIIITFLWDIFVAASTCFALVSTYLIDYNNARDTGRK